LLHSARAEDRAYRRGGDEFALVLPNTTLPDARVVLERLRRDVQRHLCVTTVSIGVAALVPGQGDPTTLQEQADAALYEAKRHGRNTIVAFEEIRASASILPPAKAQALRCLLAEGGVSVVFQPIWDIDRGAILAFEALTRPAPHYGFAGPRRRLTSRSRLDGRMIWTRSVARLSSRGPRSYHPPRCFSSISRPGPLISTRSRGQRSSMPSRRPAYRPRGSCWN